LKRIPLRNFLGQLCRRSRQAIATHNSQKDTDDLDDLGFLVHCAKVPDRPAVGQRYATAIKRDARRASDSDATRGAEPGTLTVLPHWDFQGRKWWSRYF